MVRVGIESEHQLHSSQFENRRILITVRAAPNPSQQYNETSCVAGVDLDNRTPIRLFPMPARFLNDTRRFKKYDVINAPVKKAPSDTRPESHNINHDQVEVVGHVNSTPRDGWATRWEHVRHFEQGNSICELRRQISAHGKSESPSLTLIKPREIIDFSIERKPADDWTPAEIAKMSQQNMFLPNRPPGEQLEFIPYIFRYRFLCDDPSCGGHNPSVLDWELAESYRQWTRRYGDDWERQLRSRYEEDFINNKDLRFFMGTNNQYPESWMIIGIYYPPRID